MEEIAKDVAKTLLGYGLPGIIIIVLLWVNYTLFGKLEKEQEGRREDALKSQAAFRDNTEVMKQMASELQATKQTISAMAESQRATNDRINLLSSRTRERGTESV